MPSIFVIHGPGDQAFVEGRLLKPLPALGFDRWQSSVARDAPGAGASPAAAMKKSAAILAVLSPTSDREMVGTQVSRARRTGRTVIVVRDGAVVPTADDKAWSTLPAVTAGEHDDALWRDLAALLPPPAGGGPRRSAPGAVIPWDAPVFSALLREAVDHHDYHRGDALVSSVTRYLQSHPGAYPPEPAANDLNELRRKRQFSLMSRYGAAALKSGVTDFTVRRLYAQSLIELGKFRHAVTVLTRIIKEADAKHAESFEARGLIGRVYKQQYVNAPTDPRAAGWLSRAIRSYKSVYDEDHEQVWHGVNAASLILRAARDKRGRRGPQVAHAIAKEILATLEGRLHALAADHKSLPVFDCASRVEAYVTLGEYDAARPALDEYLAHPAMQAFEVSSTYRQFDEVMELHDEPAGRDLVERLWQAVERHRAGGTVPVAGDETPAMAAGQLRPMVLRVSDPDWQPQNVPDLAIQARLGTILSISGTEATVRVLMKDPSVVALEDSRPSGQMECVRSVPFIKVQKDYGPAERTFSEGGSGALIAIIDDGIDVLHQAFLDDAGQSRIVGIWDQRGQQVQGVSVGKPPKDFGFDSNFDFGVFHDAAAIAGYVADNNAGAAMSPGLQSLTRNVDGHGTHVASIAAGRAVGQFAGGVAPEAKILFVITSGGELIGYSNAHLTALDFIDKFTRKAGLPVVVNISQGKNAGAHDGKSALEVGFDMFSKGGREPGRVVVKSAGNERDKKGHAKVVLRPGSADSFSWQSQVDPGWSRERVELWWNSANSFKFRLTAPSKQSSDWIDESQPVVKGRLSGGGPFRMELVKRHPDNGDSRLLVELGSGMGLPLAAGVWVLEIQSVKVPAQGEIHAWLERGGRAPSEFIRHQNEEMTLSIPGTAFSVITVGAIDASEPVIVGDFSSYGPTRDGREKPDVAAPGVNVIAARGGTLNDVRSESGTSMAAPHVTGAIALLLSRSAAPDRTMPTASQICAALRTLTSNYNSHFDPGQGYGVIDVAALLTAF